MNRSQVASLLKQTERMLSDLDRIRQTLKMTVGKHDLQRLYRELRYLRANNVSKRLLIHTENSYSELDKLEDTLQEARELLLAHLSKEEFIIKP